MIIARRLTLLLLLLPILTGARAEVGPPWQVLEPGLEAAGFDSRLAAAGGQQDVTVLRVDPREWDLGYFHLTGPDAPQLTPSQWASEHGLLAVINAGMYQADRRTHVGFCQQGGKVLNRAANGYLSAAALDPVDPAEPSFRIFDLDETPLAEVAARYRTVLQNLRLIKRPGRNRWQPAADRWPEAALAEDDQGRALLIHCTTPMTMHAFNEMILALPLGIVCAQHLEGNLPAQLHIVHPAWTARQTDQGPAAGRALPFVLGVESRLSAPEPPDR